ncbi:DUF421 domain-containing protein [Clostridium sp. YIM B02505]|uniref:DUF421 domain-containing protein n=1 Tax=Clostridium yunnanense TaxID=2800325 RepID=A0ABS1EKP9_9CLOT|nr:DUF421 domain-containing protein [Clostridium yunnanense]MBK1809947.1 DUF421 domain-containing protein [Clostridium yunnanense]
MHLIKELLVVAARILTILPLMLLITLYMGKRSIGELPVFDFLTIVTLGAVVGADIADPVVPHLHTAVAIVLIGIFQRIVSKWIIKYRKFGRLITFEPTIVIQNGKLVVKNLKKLRYSVDNLLQMLREQEIFDVSTVHLAIIEANGKLSVLKNPNNSAVTIEDLNLNKKSSSLSYPVIIDGVIHKDTLRKLNLDEDWLLQQLSSANVTDSNEVFFASVNERSEIHISLMNDYKSEDDIFPLHN